MERFHFTELERKFSNLIRFGKVASIDYKKARARIKIGKILTDWLPWLSRSCGDRSWQPPCLDEQVVVLSPDGEMAQGVILPALYQQKYPAPSDKESESLVLFADGSTISYDKAAHELKAYIAYTGKITLKVGQSVMEITKDSIKLKAARIDLN